MPSLDRAAYKAAWYAAHREDQLAKRAAYNAANREKVLAQKAEYRRLHPERVRQSRATHRESHAEQLKEESRAYYLANREAVKATVRAYSLRNRDKVREAAVAYRANLPAPRRAEVRAYMAAYRKAHPEKWRDARRRRRFLLGKAVRRDSVLNLRPGEWAAILAVYHHRCAYCGKARPLTQDHVIPLSRGGAHHISNIVPACRSCNSRKNAGPPLRPVPLVLL